MVNSGLIEGNEVSPSSRDPLKAGYILEIKIFQDLKDDFEGEFEEHRVSDVVGGRPSDVLHLRSEPCLPNLYQFRAKRKYSG